MTLILTINGPDTIWMLADRRLSFAHRTPKDDARKIMTLETIDGVALLGYAGLGQTAGGTEPSDWMNAVLRGRHNLSLEDSLNELAEALQRQFPKHLASLPVQFGAKHCIIVTALINDRPRLYSIEMSLNHGTGSHSFKYTKLIAGSAALESLRPPRIALAGSGAIYLQCNKTWTRTLLKLVKACDLGRIQPLDVADFLASINVDTSRGTIDKTVGSKCIILWRHRKASRHNGGGAVQFYDGTERVPDSHSLPIMVNGIDVQALIKASMPSMQEQLSCLLRTGNAPNLTTDQINTIISNVPCEPNETLT